MDFFDIYSSFNIIGDMFCKFVRWCLGLMIFCVGSVIVFNEDLEVLLIGLYNLKYFYIIK